MLVSAGAMYGRACVRETCMPLCPWGNMDACMFTCVQESQWVFMSVSDCEVCECLQSVCMGFCANDRHDCLCRGEVVALGYLHEPKQ